MTKPRPSPHPQIPLWLDCDPGHDDAFAILLAAHHPSLRLLGLSTVHGNASLPHTTDNARRVLAAVGKADIGVYPGAAKPFCRKAVFAPNIHGASGLDGTDLLPEASSAPPSHGNAVVAMRDALLAQAPGTVWLVATGALTNVALLFATFPELAEQIHGLSIMGGALGGSFSDAPMGHLDGEGERIGNVTRWAEFNIYVQYSPWPRTPPSTAGFRGEGECDPEAAQAVFSNPRLAPKTTLIPLDLTHQVLGTAGVQTALLHGPSPAPGAQPSSLRRMFYELLIFFAHTYASVFGITAGPPLHDPLAVAVILDAHGLADMAFDDLGGERWAVEVVLDGVHGGHAAESGQIGRTVATKLVSGGPGVRIPRTLDVQAFWTVLDGCLTRADAALTDQEMVVGG